MTESRKSSEHLYIGKYEILIRKVFTFAGYWYKPHSTELTYGLSICKPGDTLYSYGVGPCAAGIAISEFSEFPFFYHIDRLDFELPNQSIDYSFGGIVGGSKVEFEKFHPIIRKFKFLQNYPLSIGITNLGKNRLDIFYN